MLQHGHRRQVHQVVDRGGVEDPGYACRPVRLCYGQCRTKGKSSLIKRRVLEILSQYTINTKPFWVTLSAINVSTIFNIFLNFYENLVF